MKNFLEKCKRLIPSKRKIIQLYCALLFNANLKGFVQGNIYKGNSKAICMPGLNCYSCPGAVTACPLGSLQGSFSADRSTLFYVGGILLLYCLMFGRLICGWLCPFGLIQELLYKIKTPKLKKGPVTRILSYLKYVILVVFVFIIPIAYAFKDTPLPGFCKYICPAGTIEGGLGLLSNAVNESYFAMLGPIFTWKFLVMVSIVVACIFAFRAFCRFICPLGALYGLFNKISIFGVKVDNSKCINCDKCIRHCKMDVHHVGDQECISCGECMDVCPTNAIQWKGILRKEDSAGIPVTGNKKMRTITRAISTVLLIGLLVGAIIYYWVTTPDYVKPDVGSEVGDSCISYDVTIVDETGILTETINPTTTGKITIINFWGTWCGPCVKELPYFDQIATNYGDDVVVLAIHTSTVAETAPAYIAEHYPDSKVIFGKDDGEGFYGTFYTALGGRDTYPYTVILDEQGVIVKIFVNALHYEDLEAVVEEELKN
ncbi:MAG: 4Fe-4S binding protein [Agathobacter sp.]|nr:4Fe-4S binding protein [Agathobacter sp.]